MKLQVYKRFPYDTHITVSKNGDRVFSGSRLACVFYASYFTETKSGHSPFHVIQMNEGKDTFIEKDDSDNWVVSPDLFL